jgi:hypothetical protein
MMSQESQIRRKMDENGAQITSTQITESSVREAFLRHQSCFMTLKAAKILRRGEALTNAD